MIVVLAAVVVLGATAAIAYGIDILVAGLVTAALAKWRQR